MWSALFVLSVEPENNRLNLFGLSKEARAIPFPEGSATSCAPSATTFYTVPKWLRDADADAIAKIALFTHQLPQYGHREHNMATLVFAFAAEEHTPSAPPRSGRGMADHGVRGATYRHLFNKRHTINRNTPELPAPVILLCW